MSDHYALVSTTGDVIPLTATEKRRATLAVCDHAADVAEARLFLAMLGLAGR